jgi:hypothetical protein
MVLLIQYFFTSIVLRLKDIAEEWVCSVASFAAELAAGHACGDTC